MRNAKKIKLVHVPLNELIMHVNWMENKFFFASPPPIIYRKIE